MRNCAVGFLALITVVAVAAAPASADEQDPDELARDMAQRGGEAYGNGDLADAVKLLKGAALLDPQPEYFCSAGNVYDVMGKSAQAHLWLSQCLAGGRMAARKPKAAKSYRKMLETVEQTLRSTHAPVEISSNPSGAQVLVSAFEDDDYFTTPALVWLPIGNHTARLRADGHSDQSVPIDVANTKSQRINVSLEGLPDQPTTTELVPDTTTEPETGSNPIIGTPIERDTSSASRGKTPYILIGVGAASLITGAVFHVVASGTRADLKELGVNDPDRPDLESKFNLQRGLAIGGYAVGAVVGGIGLYLLTRSPKKSKSVALGPSPTGDGAMVWLSWSR